MDSKSKLSGDFIVSDNEEVPSGIASDLEFEKELLKSPEDLNNIDTLERELHGPDNIGHDQPTNPLSPEMVPGTSATPAEEIPNPPMENIYDAVDSVENLHEDPQGFFMQEEDIGNSENYSKAQEKTIRL